MLFYYTKKLRGMHIHAKDGVIGSVDEFFFDDRSWEIRYLVVDVDGLLSTRKVLLSPTVINDIRPEGFFTDVTVDQVRASPDIDTEKPISREMEIILHDYYGWPFYWQNIPASTATSFSSMSFPALYGMGTNEEKESLNEQLAEVEQSHLRSTDEVLRYTVSTRGGDIGAVDDFLLDGTRWIIRYIIIISGLPLARRKKVIAAAWVTRISWSKSDVVTDLDYNLVEAGPSFDPDLPFDRTFENSLYDYYHKPKYWEDSGGRR